MKWDAVHLSTPANRMTAALVHPQRTEFDPESKVRSWDVRSDAPLPMRPVPALVEDLTGMEVGRLKVIGLYEFNASGRGPRGFRWVVRCVCGYYETRRAKVLKDETYQARARCTACERSAEIIAGRGTTELPRLYLHGVPRAAEIAPVDKKPKDIPPLMRLYDAVVRAKDDCKLSDLAASANLPRENVREYLDTLVKCGALRERADGWYSRGILTTRNRS